MSELNTKIHQRVQLKVRRVIKAGDVDGEDDAYQEARAEKQLMQIWAKKYGYVLEKQPRQKEIALT